jgi:hypothetical protein
MNMSEKNNPFSAAPHPLSSQSQLIDAPNDNNGNLSLLHYNSSLDLNNNNNNNNSTASLDDDRNQKIQLLQDQFRFHDSTSINPTLLSPSHVNTLIPSSVNNNLSTESQFESESNKSPTASLLFGAGQVLKSPTANVDEQAKLLQQLQNMKREQEQAQQREREQQLRDERERDRIDMERRLEEERERWRNERFLLEEAEKKQLRQQQLLQQQQTLQQLEREQQERERMVMQKQASSQNYAPQVFVPSRQEIEDMNKQISTPKKEEAGEETFVRIKTVKNQPQAQVAVVSAEEENRSRLNLDVLKFGSGEPKAKGFDGYDEL